MTIFKTKYKRRSSYVLLLTYIFIFTLSVFHYHHIDLKNGNYYYTEESEKQSGISIDEIVGLSNECIVTHFTSTISNLNYFPEIISGENNHGVYTSLESPHKISFVVLFRNNPLRAPPPVLPS